MKYKQIYRIYINFVVPLIKILLIKLYSFFPSKVSNSKLNYNIYRIFHNSLYRQIAVYAQNEKYLSCTNITFSEPYGHKQSAAIFQVFTAISLKIGVFCDVTQWLCYVFSVKQGKKTDSLTANSKALILRNVCIYLLTYSNQKSPSWETYSSSARQEIPRIL